MKTKLFLPMLAALAVGHASLQAQTAFIYQGKLVDDCCPATGFYDLTFKVFDAAVNGNQIPPTPGGTVSKIAVPVTNGLFAVSLDFGSTPFNGARRWLEIDVRTNAAPPPATFATLSPRTELTPTPYALYAQKAGGVVSGAITPATLAASGADGKVLTYNSGAFSWTDPIWSLNPNGSDSHYNTAGKVGIGTTTPTARLHAVGSGGNVSGVRGENSGAANGVEGLCDNSGASAVFGTNTGGGFGIAGRTGGTGAAVYGHNQTPNGWAGIFDGKVLVRPDAGFGLQATSQTDNGIYGVSYGLGASGVYGENYRQGFGVAGRTTGTGIAVYGDNRDPAGLAGAFDGNVNVNGGDIRWGTSLLEEDQGGAIELGNSLGNGNRPYLDFHFGIGAAQDYNVRLINDADGRLTCSGNFSVCSLTIRGGCDLAEPFQMSEAKIPEGSVVVIDEENPGHLKHATRAYDTRVAGIVSGANGVKAGIALHQEGVLEGGQNVALTGRVYVKVDASEDPIKPGDLLTTSDTPGHAMKVTDRDRAQGAIIGKAMTGLIEGKGMVLVLVSLQ